MPNDRAVVAEDGRSCRAAAGTLKLAPKNKVRHENRCCAGMVSGGENLPHEHGLWVTTGATLSRHGRQRWYGYDRAFPVSAVLCLGVSPKFGRFTKAAGEVESTATGGTSQV